MHLVISSVCQRAPTVTLTYDGDFPVLCVPEPYTMQCYFEQESSIVRVNVVRACDLLDRTHCASFCLLNHVIYQNEKFGKTHINSIQLRGTVHLLIAAPQFLNEFICSLSAHELSGFKLYEQVEHQMCVELLRVQLYNYGFTQNVRANVLHAHCDNNSHLEARVRHIAHVRLYANSTARVFEIDPCAPIAKIQIDESNKYTYKDGPNRQIVSLDPHPTLQPEIFGVETQTLVRGTKRDRHAFEAEHQFQQQNFKRRRITYNDCVDVSEYPDSGMEVCAEHAHTHTHKKNLWIVV